MKPVCIVRHVECEGPGYLATFLQRREIPFEVVAVDRGDPLPVAVGGMSALVLMGGSMSVNDPLAWIPPELDLVREAVGRGLPVLGHCLGGQLISKALGGTVVPNPVREIGWLPVERVDARDPGRWRGAVPDRFVAFHWHGETFSLPAGATPILRSAHCANQGFVFGNTLALQCHVEMTAGMVLDWAQRFSHELCDTSVTVQSPARMTEALPTRVGELQAVADVLYDRWLEPIDARF